MSSFKRGGFFVFALSLVFALGDAASAAPFGHELIVNPIQVRADDGTMPANPSLTLFEAEADKIWSQAGIDIVFLPWNTWDSSASLTINATSELLLVGNQAIAGVTNMWFVDTYVGAFGAAHSGGNRVAIADNVFSFAGGLGRRDTIAHELGHILGLPHDPAVDPNNLMTTGGSRNAATSIGQITPDGFMWDQLTAAQITSALASDYLVHLADPIPEPGTLVLLSVSGVIAIRVRRRRKAAA